MEALEITCRYCEAGPGEGCQSRNGKPRLYFHNARLVDASSVVEQHLHMRQQETPAEPTSGKGWLSRLFRKSRA